MPDDIKRATATTSPRMLLPGVLWQVIRTAGLVWWTLGFAIVFTVSTVIVNCVEPHITDIQDAAWLMFQVVTTIGLGDLTCTTTVGRIVTMVLSLYSVFFLALITGAVVSFCGESMSVRRDESVARFIDDLERLPELSHEELVELSLKVKRLDQIRSGRAM